MPRQKFKLTAILAAVLILPMMNGCSKPIAQQEPNGSDTTVASTPDAAVPAIDIATQPNTLPEKDASAKQVCERFLGLLAQGERNLAEQLLTRRALKLTVAAGLELDAMGDSESSVEIGDAMYATTRAKVAQVPCTTIGKDGSQQKIQWLMRRGESGWRIAGLIIDSGTSQEFLSLESEADVASIVGSDEKEPSDSVGLVSHEEDVESGGDESQKLGEKLDTGS